MEPTLSIERNLHRREMCERIAAAVRQLIAAHRQETGEQELPAVRRQLGNEPHLGCIGEAGTASKRDGKQRAELRVVGKSLEEVLPPTYTAPAESNTTLVTRSLKLPPSRAVKTMLDPDALSLVTNACDAYAFTVGT